MSRFSFCITNAAILATASSQWNTPQHRAIWARSGLPLLLTSKAGVRTFQTFAVGDAISSHGPKPTFASIFFNSDCEGKADGVDGSRSRHLKCQSVVVIETITSKRNHLL